MAKNKCEKIEVVCHFPEETAENQIGYLIGLGLYEELYNDKMITSEQFEACKIDLKKEFQKIFKQKQNNS